MRSNGRIAASEGVKSQKFSKKIRKVANFTYEFGVENGNLTSYFGMCTYQNTYVRMTTKMDKKCEKIGMCTYQF